MAYVATQGIFVPEPYEWTLVAPGLAYSAGGLIDATGEKIAFIGRVWNKDRASKNISKVGIRFGAVTKAGGSALTLSLQDVALATGPIYVPDETQDQTVAIGNAAITANSWLQTNALSASRTVAFGELLAVVIEFDGSGRLGADSFVISTLSLPASQHLADGSVLKAGAGPTWAAISTSHRPPALVLEFDDGTFGALGGSVPAANLSSIAYNSGSAADEIALEFTVPFACKCDGAWFMGQCASGADFDIVLYDGTTAIASQSFDANAIIATAQSGAVFASWTEVTLSTSATYRLALKPTTTNSVTAHYMDVNASGHWQAMRGFAGSAYTTRVDGGAWAATTATRRPMCGISISALSDVSSSAGGHIASRQLTGM